MRTCPVSSIVALCKYRLVLRLAGVVPEVTMRTAAPLVEPDVPVIVASPTEAVVTRPALLTLKTPAFEDVHVVEDVRFCVLPSVYVPVAVSCWVDPLDRLAAFGVMTSEVSVGEPTVSGTD